MNEKSIFSDYFSGRNNSKVTKIKYTRQIWQCIACTWRDNHSISFRMATQLTSLGVFVCNFVFSCISHLRKRIFFVCLFFRQKMFSLNFLSRQSRASDTSVPISYIDKPFGIQYHNAKYDKLFRHSYSIRPYVNLAISIFTYFEKQRYNLEP